MLQLSPYQHSEIIFQMPFLAFITIAECLNLVPEASQDLTFLQYMPPNRLSVQHESTQHDISALLNFSHNAAS